MIATDLAQMLRDRVTYDDRFQAACQRYAHENGSSSAIAAAAVHVIRGAFDSGADIAVSATTASAIFDWVAARSHPSVATAWTCGLAATTLAWMLRLVRLSPVVMTDTIRGVGHMWVEMDGRYYDPTIGQFGEFPGSGLLPHPLSATPAIRLADGYVLVPAVATREMVDAADACTDAYSAYAAMVEVARVR